MRIGIIWPEDTALAGTTVRFERYLHGFGSLGHDAVIVATEAASAGFPYPIWTVPDRASLLSPRLWRDLNLDAALLCTWLVHTDLMRAARPYARHLLSLADSDGCLGVRVHPWSLLGRMWVLQPRLLDRLRSALWWLRQLIGLDVRRDNEVLASCRLADRIIVFSPGAQENLKAFFRYHREEGLEGRITVAPYPVDETFEASPLVTTREDQVVAIGRWDDPQKDVELLVGALAQVLRQRTATRCLILGPGGDQALQTLTTAWADRIEYLGAVPPLRVREILDHSRCLLSTSRWESGPIVAAEALLRGCSLVGPQSIPSFRQFCRNGACGTTFASRSPSAVAAALKSELQAWDVGDRHPERIAACWRGCFLATSVCERLLTGLGEAVRAHEHRRPR
jgi:glycosyltransferase involved in cell wall biosynthesis